MKTKHIIGYTFLIGVLACTAASAQELKTTESVIQQFKQNKVPGLQYGANKQNEDLKTNLPVRNTKQDFWERTFTGGIPKSVETKSASRLNVVKGSKSSLPSESAVPVKEQKNIIAPKMPPTQGSEKGN